MTRTLILATAVFFSTALLFGAQNNEDLILSADGCHSIYIDSGAGYLKIQGREGIKRVEVRATLEGDGMTGSELSRFRREYVDLKLEKSGSRAVLTSKLLTHRSGLRYNMRINLDVSLPPDLKVSVNDGSGDIEIRGISDALDIRDGSGEISAAQIAGRVRIEDGSGTISLNRIQGDVELNDGSGEIELSGVQGDVDVRDGSGAIDVRNVIGSIRIDDGSGPISIDGVENDVIIDDAGSGGVHISNVRGAIRRR